MYVLLLGIVLDTFGAANDVLSSCFIFISDEVIFVVYVDLLFVVLVLILFMNL